MPYSVAPRDVLRGSSTFASYAMNLWKLRHHWALFRDHGCQTPEQIVNALAQGHDVSRSARRIAPQRCQKAGSLFSHGNFLCRPGPKLSHMSFHCESFSSTVVATAKL
eukprot:3944576-Amphidinium_carterae.1